MSTSQLITPNVWCNRNAEEVGRFYAEVFANTTSTVTSRYPESAADGLADFQADFAGAALTVEVDLDGFRLVLINAGDEFSPNPSVSLTLNFDPLLFEGSESAARNRLDEIWAGLSDGGSELMPLAEYPFSKHYGWVQDRHGVSWQLILTDPAGDPRPFVMPSLMFSGSAQNKAAEATDHYLSAFSAAGLSAEQGNRVHYPAAQGPVTTESVMFSDIKLAGQWITVMDSGVEQPFGFTCGMSLQVDCADQAQIDSLWQDLSAVPEAEQCGWLADLAGLSWQIVPADMGELMKRPGAYDHMMVMKKIIIADL